MTSSSSHPVIHLLHDVGLAAWFGGSLMGAVGLNGATAQLDDPTQRSHASTAGWSRWAPVNAAAVGAHLVGAAGLTLTDLSRIRTQQGVGKSSAVKAGLTGAGLGVAAWSAVLNRKMAAAGPVPVAGATEPGAGTPADVARTQRQLKLVQWLNPLVGFGLLVATAVHEEQMRTSQQVKGRLQGLTRSPMAAGIAAAGLGLLAARRRRSRSQVEVVQLEAPRAVPSPPMGTGRDLSSVGTTGSGSTGSGSTGTGSTGTGSTGTAGTGAGMTGSTTDSPALVDLTDGSSSDAGSSSTTRISPAPGAGSR